MADNMQASGDHAVPLASIKTTLDPNQITFKPLLEVFPVWLAVLRYRYMAHLPLQNKNFQTEWTDYVTSKPAGIEPVAPNAIRYNDGRIVVRALPKDVVQTTIRVKYSDKLKYVLHLYYTTCNILVQGNGCLQWVREDFDRLQGVVAMLAATLPSLSKKELKAAWDSVADVLTVPPEDDQSSVIQAHAIEWPEPAPTSAANPTVTLLSNSAECSTVTRS